MKKILSALVLISSLVLVACSEVTMYIQNSPANIYGPASVDDSEEYADIAENPFIATADMPVSTFSTDVDTAAYSIIRRKLSDGQMPNVNAVRIEEMLNYFSYDLDAPEGDGAIRVTTEYAAAPWNPEHGLLLIGLKTPDIEYATSAPSNLVFLLDVSGSMGSDDKLPLLQSAIRLLVDQLRPADRISIVVYAGASGVILDGGDVSDKEEILDAIDGLQAGGSTAGGAGINLAYQIAAKHFIEGGNNRVILGTDGDFNVGVSSTAAMEDLIESKRESGIFLSVLGFGVGNLKDDKMEALADHGNGAYYYIDSILEAKKVFMDELGASLVTVAKDVKLQIEFNPLQVKGYRLIGYENRILSYEDFNDDEADAGDMGAGHEVIALYEIIPVGSGETIEAIDGDLPEVLKYDGVNLADELLTLSIRYKQPDAEVSELIETVVGADAYTVAPSARFLFAASVAEFGLLLRDSPYQGESSYQAVIARVTPIVGDDDYKAEFIELVRIAAALSDR